MKITLGKVGKARQRRGDGEGKLMLKGGEKVQYRMKKKTGEEVLGNRYIEQKGFTERRKGERADEKERKRKGREPEKNRD